MMPMPRSGIDTPMMASVVHGRLVWSCGLRFEGQSKLHLVGNLLVVAHPPGPYCSI